LGENHAREDLPMTNPLYDTLFGRHAGREATFIVRPDGSRISYAAFLGRAAQVAHVLRRAGVKPGDRVAVQVEKSAEAVALYAACAQAGAVFLPLNTAYTAAEVAYFVENAEPSLVVGGAGGAMEQVAGSLPFLTLEEDGSGTLAAAADAEVAVFETVARGEDDLAAFLYTSGTTGRSKGAMLTQRNLLSNARALTETWGFTDADVLLHALPIFHSHGLFVAINVTLTAGCAMILLPKFDPDAVIRWLPKATTMMGVPTFYVRLLEDQRLTRDLVAHIRLFVSGSAPLLAETHRSWEARTGHRILERYGMTETNMNTSNPYDGERRAGSVGFALPGTEVRVVDPETRAELPAGEIGMVEVRGPNVFVGYWRMPEKTAEELKPDGFFITGDLGRFDEDGYLHIVGRGKDLVISGGYNVYPKEVEMAIDDLPGVMESAVIGVPHPDLGEVPLAVVVPEAGAVLEAEALAAALRDKLARFKQPRAWEIVEALPRNTMGKVQKNVLRERFGRAFARTGA
jgi:malonyl-CoA/methylmalonyl-CoA synthetase